MAAREGVTLICSSGKTRCSSSAQARDINVDPQIEAARALQFVPMIKRDFARRAAMDQNLRWRDGLRIATAGSVTEMRFSRSVVLMSSDLPTMTRSGRRSLRLIGLGRKIGGLRGWRSLVLSGIEGGCCRLLLLEFSTRVAGQQGQRGPSHKKRRTNFHLRILLPVRKG